MTGSHLRVVLDYLGRSAALGGEGERTDGQLLDCFTATHDEGAFETLVRRHGRLVLSVCRSVLGDEHETEDAFQATFLILVKKARAIRRHESLRSWLYGVAHRVAVRARVARAKRLQSERQVVRMTLSDPSADTARQELSRLLHDEVLRLPDRYRLPVLLCCLEGKSRHEAARELGWSEGAVKGRLERARQRLHARLVRRGLTLSMVLAAVDVARAMVPACVPRPLVLSTTKAAAQWATGRAAGLIPAGVTALTEGVFQGRWFTRLRLGMVFLLLLAGTGAGAGLLAGGGSAGEAAAPAPAAVTLPRERLDDNPLGLVPARDPRRPGAVLLHGGGAITGDARARFLQLAGGKDARIVLVPSATFGRRHYGNQHQFAAAMRRQFPSWVRLVSTGRIRHLEFLATDDPADAEDAAFARPLASATGVWFCGGDQLRLNYRYVGKFPRRTRFQQALRDVVARGGVVGGTSAGMAALPEVMTLAQERYRPTEPYRVVAGHGLGLFDAAIVEQHFDVRNGRLERFTGLLRDSARLDRLTGRPAAGARMFGLAVETGTALVLQSNRLEVLGTGNVHVFIKSPDGRTTTWHTLASAEKAILKHPAGATAVLATLR
jgi:cyanophycinase